MDESKKLTQKALASLIGLVISSGANGATPTVPSAPGPAKGATTMAAPNGWIQCYGVAAANKNDCATPLAACPGTIAQPGACYAWIYTPKEICEKLNNASVGKAAPDCKIPTPGGVPGTT